MTYVVITFIVLLFLNIYCSRVSQQLFNRSKEASLIEKCDFAADEIAGLEVINTDTVAELIDQMDSLKATRLIVTDQSGLAIYDSSGTAEGTYALLPEILDAMSGEGGNDAFSWVYQEGTTHSRAATPIVYYGTIIGCVYMTEYDTTHGALLRSLEITVLQITFTLETILILFSFVFSGSFSRRMRKIMTSMRTIQDGDYSHKLVLGGNDELTILGNEFNALTERLHTSEKKRRRFVSDASHELKTPLASIKLLTDSILQNDMDAETVREFVEDIGNEAERLNRMTAKLLTLTKLDTVQESESEIIYMAPTVRRVSRMLSPVAQTADIRLVLELAEDCPVLILEDDLYQIVFNLMENGIKYNTPGGSLTVSLSRDEENASLTVRDTGVGIPSDAIDHIFERFYRVDKARSRASGGSGLGLSIVRGIVERNRGEIRAESVPGSGTAFTVTFPAFDTEVDRE
ncbi:MAG: HAMP domain-containing histidine kinase [Oscillospiraceae bacterium]|nr:HAMP domain-containing histidine kinase [Oscillospiraceae bacterium]